MSNFTEALLEQEFIALLDQEWIPPIHEVLSISTRTTPSVKYTATPPKRGIKDGQGCLFSQLGRSSHSQLGRGELPILDTSSSPHILRVCTLSYL